MNPSDRKILVRLASALPSGSEEKRALSSLLGRPEPRELSLIASSDSFKTVSGKRYKIRTVDFARFLSAKGIRGVAAGEYLREESLIPDDWLLQMKDFGAQFTESGPRPVNIDKLWDDLVGAISKMYRGQGADAGDMFVNMPPEYDEEDFEYYLQTVSGDLAQSYDHSLSGPAESLHEKFISALRAGLYRGGEYERWNLRDRVNTLRSIAADAWYDEMIRGWEKIKSNPNELARLKAARPRD